MSQENKIQILSQLCQATQEKAQNLEKYIRHLKQVFSNFYLIIRLISFSN